MFFIQMDKETTTNNTNIEMRNLVMKCGQCGEYKNVNEFGLKQYSCKQCYDEKQYEFHSGFVDDNDAELLGLECLAEVKVLMDGKRKDKILFLYEEDGYTTPIVVERTEEVISRLEYLFCDEGNDDEYSYQEEHFTKMEILKLVSAKDREIINQFM